MKKGIWIYLNTTKSLVNVFLHKALEDGHRLFTQPDRIEHIVVKNRFEQIILVVGLKMSILYFF